ncbi:MAG: hypothetical protein GWN14_10185 [candidate division Zixibacteria bacterium]|nr:hypothetical protein [Gammaproteobacteria bacterium]NIX56273.1 hypothetical protein [candidate division Zixibacteria bacterium]
MFYERKTKDRRQFFFIIYPITALAIFFGIATTAGFGLAFYVLGGIFILTSIMPFITFFKTQNTGYLILALYLTFAGLMCVSAPPAIEDKSKAGLTPIFLVIMYVLMIISGYHLLTRRLKWRGQEVFELAAMPIEDTGNSYTPRPRPAGQTKVSKTEMVRFVDFITRNLVAFAFKEENRIVFVLALPGYDTPYLLGLKKNYLDDTWVSIDYDGNVSVNITEEDYLLFKQDLNFDQLCASLGNVFIEFLELSKNGQEQQIIDKMNALRLSPLA